MLIHVEEAHYTVNHTRALIMYVMEGPVSKGMISLQLYHLDNEPEAARQHCSSQKLATSNRLSDFVTHVGHEIVLRLTEAQRTCQAGK
jgi:hypothetical protein